MKIKSIKFITLLILMLVISCDEPDTVITNWIHPDGSVTRMIEMRSSKNEFKSSDIQVPFDKTWAVTDSLEIDESGDTIWIRRAEKLFKNVEEINLSYVTDSGANRHISRRAGFERKFKWFNTEYRFSESIDQVLPIDYHVRDFLNDDELIYFYSPDNLKYEKEMGPDSLKYRALSDSVSQKTEMWSIKCLIAVWIDEFSKLIRNEEGGEKAIESLKSHEDDLFNMALSDEEILDSLWFNGIILQEYIGSVAYEKFKEKSDTANERTVDQLWVDFKEYSVRAVLPGKVTRTNGFIDSSEVLLWPVKSDYFLTEAYEMWAESKTPNKWAWIFSGLFLVFVFTGVILRIIKRG